MFGRFRGAFRFSEGCRRALLNARAEARRLRHDYVGTEHILLALMDGPDDDAVQLVADLGLVPKRMRKDVEALVREPRSAPARGAELPYTSRAKKSLELAMGEAHDLAAAAVGTGHLLLGLIREEKGIAAQVLQQHGVDYITARAAVAGELAEKRKRFSIRIDDNADRSIYEQIIAQVQEAVATAELSSGGRLPAVRELADELDIAPGTVARAYTELERLGVVVTDGARGTRVAPRTRHMPAAVRPDTLVGLLRPVAVAAFHLGASAPEVRQALDDAMRDIFPTAPPP
ncbi:MAG TPA: Clp protease N-terminal domain-containing protein [Gemmatimonadaceae bacterium]|nr:Clp protease N-terminal domain-containing protein [Gemmatimonadaceae bacterium]